MFRFRTSLVFVASLFAAQAQAEMIGINVLLGTEVSDEILAGLEEHGQVLDVLAEINAVTMKAQDSELAVIQALPFVAAANPDAKRFLAANEPLPWADFVDGANHWTLDAINVTDVDAGRMLDYTGEGVYVAVIDSGLVHNWREYFPEERIATEHARAFGGGGGDQGTVSAQPDKWEHDTVSHGTSVAGVILGFSYSGPEDLPATFNGVAPRVTVIPVKVASNSDGSEGFGAWSSVITHALVYLTNLKSGGALGAAPLVVNMSFGGEPGVPDAIEEAAVDYAISNGLVIIAAAGNEAESGMTHPGFYPPVISAGASGWLRQFPSDDPTVILWLLRDVPEHDALEHFVAPFSARELPGQDLDVVAPGFAVPVPYTADGRADYNFVVGTSFAAPHVAGIAALMLERNPNLTQSLVEEILESTAAALAPGCREFVFPVLGPGNEPTWRDHGNLSFIAGATCWDADAAGHGLAQAEAALDATPWP